MKRLIDHYLLNWKDSSLRQPLLLRGARQVGKTHAVRELSKTYPDFVEINFDLNRRTHVIFEKDLDPARIISDLSSMIKKPITPGKTLLFFDEIQAIPNAITALRYFYEMLPEQHIIAAGSLLDFAIEKVGIPVGRVQSLYMYPLSFIEFLAAGGEYPLIQAILDHHPEQEMSTAIHNKSLELLGQYLALGGMPRVVQEWQTTRNLANCSMIHATIIDSYRQDFGKYARQSQIEYVDKLFENVPIQLGRKFKYSAIDGDFRKRELAPALDLLVTAGIVHKVYHSSGQGIPIGAQADLSDYKIIHLDVGIAQAILGLDVTELLINPIAEFVNKGALFEAFVGQEMLGYASPYRRQELYYWHRESPSSQAEVDYLTQQAGVILPIEVKSGTGRTLKSMQMFLGTHPASPYGIRFSTNNYSVHERIHSYPVYAIAVAFARKDEEKEALRSLI